MTTSKLLTTPWLSLALAGLFASPALCAQAPQPAERFVDSIGVNTHLFYGPPYTDYATIANPMLINLGIHHIRDGMAIDNPHGTYWSELNVLGSACIKSDLVFFPQWNQTPASVVSCTVKHLLGSEEVIEGPNEWDYNGGSSWQATFFTSTTGLQSAFRANPATAGIPIYSATIVTPPDTNSYVSKYGADTLYVSFGNAHTYCWSWNPNNPEHGIAVQIPELSPLWGSAPFVITETGYHTSSANGGVDPIIQGKYELRTLFVGFNLGAYRTYLYEMFDEGIDKSNSEQNYGIATYDGTPKPAYNAIRNVLKLLADPGPAFKPKALDWSLVGDTAHVQTTLLQKRNGDYYLAMWIGAASSDAPISQRVRVTVPHSITRATLYTLDNSGGMTASKATIVNGAIKLCVTDTVCVVRLSPVRR